MPKISKDSVRILGFPKMGGTVPPVPASYAYVHPSHNFIFLILADPEFWPLKLFLYIKAYWDFKKIPGRVATLNLNFFRRMSTILGNECMVSRHHGGMTSHL